MNQTETAIPPAPPVLRAAPSAIVRAAKRSRTWQIAGGCAVVLGAFIYSIIPNTVPLISNDSAAAKLKEPSGAVLHEIGTIAAHAEIPVLSRFAGEIVWRADDGTFVEAGDPLVKFDAKLMIEDVENREKDLLDRKEAVRRAQADIDTAVVRYKQLLRSREIDLEKAQLERKRIFDFPLPDDRLDVELTLKAAEIERRQFRAEYDAYEELAKQGFASDASLKKKRLDLATREAAYAKSKLIFDLTTAGSTKDAKRVADLSVADAEKTLAVVKFNRDADLEYYKAALKLAQIDLATVERDLKRKKQYVDNATARAPARGRVVFQNVWKGSMKNMSPVQVGETRNDGTDLCTICDVSAIAVTVWINESDINSVEISQKAKVKLPAMPGRTFDAVVKEIAVVARDKNAAISDLAMRRSGEAFVNVVKVKLEFGNLTDADRNQIRVGFTADVTIYAKEYSGVEPRNETKQTADQPKTSPRAQSTTLNYFPSLCSLCALWLNWSAPKGMME